MRRVAPAVLPEPLEKRQADPFGLGGEPAGARMGTQQEPESSAALAIERHAAAVTEHAATVPRARVAGVWSGHSLGERAHHRRKSPVLWKSALAPRKTGLFNSFATQVRMGGVTCFGAKALDVLTSCDLISEGLCRSQRTDLSPLRNVVTLNPIRPTPHRSGPPGRARDRTRLGVVGRSLAHSSRGRGSLLWKPGSNEQSRAQWRTVDQCMPTGRMPAAPEGIP